MLKKTQCKCSKEHKVTNAKWYEYLFVIILLVVSITGLIYINNMVPKTKTNVFDWSKK